MVLGCVRSCERESTKADTEIEVGEDELDTGTFLRLAVFPFLRKGGICCLKKIERV